MNVWGSYAKEIKIANYRLAEPVSQLRICCESQQEAELLEAHISHGLDHKRSLKNTTCEPAIPASPESLLELRGLPI
jgi:hypothetical protein